MLSTASNPNAIVEAYLSGLTYTELSERTGRSETQLWDLVNHACQRRQITDRAKIAAAAREERMQDFISTVGRIAGEVFGLQPGEIWNDRRFQRLTRARQAVHLVCVEYWIPTAVIGRAFEMDHTTVCHGRDKTRALIATDPEHAALVDTLRARVRAERGDRM